MKKKLLLLPLILGGLYFILSSNASGPATVSSLNGTGATGTTGCSCHTSATTTTVSIELDTLGGGAVTTYVPGGVYTIKMTGTNTSATSLPKFGFQLCAVKSVGSGSGSATTIGTLAASGTPTPSHITTLSGIPIFEQGAALTATSGTGGSGTTYVSSIQWTAPASAGVGAAKFYGVVNAVNGTGSSAGDKYNTANITIPERVAAITGLTSVCVGANITLSDATTGGTWSSGATGIATVTTGGVVHGVSAGTVTISYDAGTSGIATYSVTVVGPPSAGAITGTADICAGGNNTLSNPTAPGGSWSTTTPAIVTITSGGVVTGLSAGTAIVSYAVTGTCGTSSVGTSFTVNALPNAGTLTGTDSLCIGGTTVLTSSGSSGGTWSSGALGIATVNTAGIVFGVSTGTATITYTATTASCGSATATRNVRVKPNTDAGVTTGLSTICAGATTSLTPSVTGGIWSSTNLSVATVNAATGVVSGVSGGTANIVYTLTGFCGTDTANFAMTVLPTPNVGVLTGDTTLCTGSSAVFHDPFAGGTWTVGTAGVISVTGAAGDSATINGVAAGTSTLTYTATNACGSSSTVRHIIVDDAITGGTVLGPTNPCPGVAVTYTYSGSTGTGSTVHWYSSNTSVATITAGTGVGGTVVGASGSTNISVAISNACNSDSVSTTVTLQTAPNAGTLSGASTICVGANTTLTPSVGGGTWSSGATGVATVNSGGQVGGVSAGNATISYAVSNSCGTAYATRPMTVNTTPSAGTLSGSSTVCVGAVTTITPTVTGGTWTSGATGTATVNASGGVTGVAAGNVNITYTVSNTCGSNNVVKAMTVNPLPVGGTISGGSSLCPGTSISLSTTGSGGAWSSSNTALATVDGSGNVFAVAAGPVTISYSVTNSCGTASATHPVTVNPPASAGTISGSAFVCIGTSSSLSSTVSGGTWSSSNTAIITVSPSGVATGVAVGTADITYTATNSCGTATAVYPMSSGLSASAGTITGPSSVCVGASVTLVDLVSGGTWSSSSTSIATVNPTTGRVTGVAAGNAIITYLVTTSCGTASTISNITVIDLPSPGVINGESTICVGATVSLTATVPGGAWSSTAPGIASVDGSGNVTGVNAGTAIIVYGVTNVCGTATALHTMLVNPLPVLATITGADTVCQGGTAIMTSSATGGTWSMSNAAASISTSGVVTGVGFGPDTVLYTSTTACGTLIGWHEVFVLPTSVPAITGSVNVCLGDTVVYGTVVPAGTWTVSNSNATIDPATGTLIGVTAGADTVTYTVVNTCGTASATLVINVLTPAQCLALGVNNVQGAEGISLYPNPADGMVTIEMPQQHSDAIATITDVTGKVVMTVVINAGVQHSPVDLSHLASGSYLVRITSGSLTFRDKLIVR
jgi:uncharacterized protein YjdB